jgi:hypothetical protein
VCPREDRDEAAITERLGRPYMLEAPLRIKQFPACNPGHPLIGAALRLCGQHVFSANEIELIEADLRTFSLLRPLPWDEISAGFSGAFLLAASLPQGTFSLDQLSEEMVPRAPSRTRGSSGTPFDDARCRSREVSALRGASASAVLDGARGKADIAARGTMRRSIFDDRRRDAHRTHRFWSTRQLI